MEQMYLPAKARQTPARAACLVYNIAFQSHFFFLYPTSYCCQRPPLPEGVWGKTGTSVWSDLV